MTEEINTQANTQLATMESLRSGSGVMSTFKSDDFSSKLSVLNALTNAVQLADNLETEFKLANVVTQAVTITDAVTGDAKPAVRVILLSDDGTAYACVSDGIVGSLRDIFGVLGQPDTWAAPLTVKAVEQKGNAGRKFMKLVVLG